MAVSGRLARRLLPRLLLRPASLSGSEARRRSYVTDLDYVPEPPPVPLTGRGPCVHVLLFMYVEHTHAHCTHVRRNVALFSSVYKGTYMARQ